MNEERDLKVKSLAKAMAVLEQFSTEKPELGVSEIAKNLSLQKATVYNILNTYKELGYVSQNPDNDKYFLSLKLLHFGYIINNRIGLKKILKNTIKEISAETNEICYLGIINEDKVLYLDAEYPNNSVFRAISGETAPLYCTGLGKALLAFLPEEEQKDILKLPRKQYTENTIVQSDDLKKELERIRSVGYAVDNMEHEYGIRCIAVPIFDGNKKVTAAISVSGPSLRLSDDRIEMICRLIKQKTDSIRDKL